MGNIRPSQNLRKTVRCMVDDSRRQCELSVGSYRQTAWLLDESTGGFSVLIEHLAGLEVGQTAELHTDTGWFAVQIRHIAEIDPSQIEGIEPGGQEPWYRLGLSRLALTAIPIEPTALWPDVQQGRQSNSGRLLVAAAVLMLALGVAIPLAVFKLDWRSKSSTADSPTQWVEPESPDNSPHRVLAPQATATDRGKKLASGRSAGHTPSSVHLTDAARRGLQAMLRRLPGATGLTLPEVVQQLQLTPDQQKQIHQLIDDAAKGIRDLDKELSGWKRQDIAKLREKLLDQARHDALKLLTKEQRAQWDELVGK